MLPLSVPEKKNDSATLRCVLVRPLFSSGDGADEKNGAFSVWAVQAPDGQEMRATAQLPANGWGEPGDEVEIEGEWTEHPRYGRQIKVLSIRPYIPRDAAGVARWLEQRPGLGPATAARVLRQLGLPGPEALERICRDPSCVDTLGLPEGRRAALVEAARAYFWEGKRAEVLAWLYQHGLGPGRAAVVWAAYGEEAPARISADPWGSLSTLDGFGFALADDVARRLGVDPAAESRMAAAVLYVLNEAAYGEGHVFLPRPELEKRVMLLLARIAESTGYGRGRSAGCLAALRAAIAHLAAAGEIVEVRTGGGGSGAGCCVYLSSLYFAEEGVRGWLASRSA